MFDDLILLAEGHAVYQGPVAGVREHFAALGFPCPARKDLPSFLQEVTTPAGAPTPAGHDMPYVAGAACALLCVSLAYEPGAW